MVRFGPDRELPPGKWAITPYQAVARCMAPLRTHAAAPPGARASVRRRKVASRWSSARVRRGRRTTAAGLPGQALDAERAGRAVGFEIDPTDQVVAEEEREDVAVDPLRRGDIDPSR